MVKRVLVTGLCGFVGRNVVAPLLSRGFEIHGTTSRAGQSAIAGVQRLHEIDLLEGGAAAGLISEVTPTHLLHLAWAPSGSRMRDPAENRAWTRASLSLFEAFAQAPGRRAVFAGSCAEYDWSHEVLSEATTPSKAATVYGAAKNAVREAIAASSAALAHGSAWARLFFLYGPHEPRGRLVSDVCVGLIENRPIELSEGRQERDYLHVADAAEALAALLDGDLRGIINIGSGRAVAIRDIARLLGERAGRPDLLAFGRRPLAPGEPSRLVADIGRLSRDLAFAPKYRLEAGLAQTLEWWRNEHHV
jgi:nucleoside-diphosphate-sugar epimerase